MTASGSSPRWEKIGGFVDFYLDLLPGIRSIDEIHGLPVQVPSRGSNELAVFLKGDAGVGAETVAMADPLRQDAEVCGQEDHDAGSTSQGVGYLLEIREAPTQGVLSSRKASQLSS